MAPTVRALDFSMLLTYKEKSLVVVRSRGLEITAPNDFITQRNFQGRPPMV
jgi:hypothetical protein